MLHAENGIRGVSMGRIVGVWGPIERESTAGDEMGRGIGVVKISSVNRGSEQWQYPATDHDPVLVLLTLVKFERAEILDVLYWNRW